VRYVLLICDDESVALSPEQIGADPTTGAGSTR
jgi:hypothetical protein